MSEPQFNLSDILFPLHVSGVLEKAGSVDRTLKAFCDRKDQPLVFDCERLLVAVGYPTSGNPPWQIIRDQKPHLKARAEGLGLRFEDHFVGSFYSLSREDKAKAVLDESKFDAGFMFTFAIFVWRWRSSWPEVMSRKVFGPGRRHTHE
jgi:hypothetical protein